MDWDRKWFIDFNAGKTQLVLFDQSKNTGAIDVKMDWISALILSLLLKLSPRKLQL